jgi:hypothetical protein
MTRAVVQRPAGNDLSLPLQSVQQRIEGPLGNKAAGTIGRLEDLKAVALALGQHGEDHEL